MCWPSVKPGSRMAGTIPLLSYLPRIHNRFPATAPQGVRLPFQLGLCYKGASVADGDRHRSPVRNLTAVRKGTRRMEFASGLQGAFTFLPQWRIHARSVVPPMSSNSASGSGESVGHIFMFWRAQHALDIAVDARAMPLPPGAS
jgi:hypothetical protein